jgi:hypothetical protein
VNPDPEEQTPTDATGTGADAHSDHLVDETVDESFPASDPPSGWAGEDPRDLAPADDHGADGPADDDEG